MDESDLRARDRQTLADLARKRAKWERTRLGVRVGTADDFEQHVLARLGLGGNLFVPRR